jgi:hypothetical protein
MRNDARVDCTRSEQIGFFKRLSRSGEVSKNVLAPWSAMEFVDLDFEEAMRFAFTAGVSPEKA